MLRYVVVLVVYIHTLRRCEFSFFFVVFYAFVINNNYHTGSLLLTTSVPEAPLAGPFANL